MDIVNEGIHSKLSPKMKERIRIHCLNTSIEKVMKQITEVQYNDPNIIIKDGLVNTSTKTIDDDREPEIVLFNYVSNFIKNNFPNELNDKKGEAKELIYEAFEEFLHQWNRPEDQIKRTLVKIKNHDKPTNLAPAKKTRTSIFALLT